MHEESSTVIINATQASNNQEYDSIKKAKQTLLPKSLFQDVPVYCPGPDLTPDQNSNTSLQLNPKTGFQISTSVSQVQHPFINHPEFTNQNRFPNLTNEHKNANPLPQIFLQIRDEDEKKSLGKQVSKIKYFWRGTNMNYPFAFQKVKATNRNKKQALDFYNSESKNDENSFEEEESQDGLVFEEDLSNKVINPAEKFYK